MKTFFNYSIRITNVGSAKASSVEVEDVLPAAFISMPAVPGCQPFGNTVRCFNLMIEAGKSLTIGIQVQSPSSPGPIVNTARAWWGNPRQGPVSGSVGTNVTPLRTDETGGERLAVRTFLDIEPYNGRSRGRVIFNDSEAVEIANTSPVVHHVGARAGENRVEATLLAGGARSRGFWRFDFGGARLFVPGSIRVDSGQVYAQDERSITFAVGEGSTVRFRYQADQVEANR